MTASEEDAVEAALAAALTGAAAAGQWEVVSQVTRELEARRELRSAGNVMPIALPQPLERVAKTHDQVECADTWSPSSR